MSKHKDPNRQCNWSWGSDKECDHECQYLVVDHPEGYHFCCDGPGGEMFE